jgi:Spy/CpxP family protein refolding chaperone
MEGHNMNTTRKIILLFTVLICFSHIVVADQTAENNSQTDEKEVTNVNDNAQQDTQQKELTPEQQQAIKEQRAADLLRAYEKLTPEQHQDTQSTHQQALLAHKQNTLLMVSLFSGACLGASLYCRNLSIKQYLRRLAIVEPLARWIATRNGYRNLCNHLPFLRCVNEQCPGICNRCKLKIIYKEIPLRLSLMLFLNWILGPYTFI